MLVRLSVTCVVAVDAGDCGSNTVETQHNNADTSVSLIDDDDDEGANN